MSPCSRNKSRDPEGTTLIPHLACASVMTNQSQRELGVGKQEMISELLSATQEVSSPLQ